MRRAALRGVLRGALLGAAGPAAAGEGPWFVIVSASPDAAQAHAAKARLVAAAVPGVQVEHLRSEGWSNLAPCLEVVLAGRRPDPAAAEALRAAVAAKGLDVAVKQAGAPQPAAAARARCAAAGAAPRLAVGRAGALWVPLPGEPLPAGLGAAKPLDAARDTWAAAAPGVSAAGGLRVGQSAPWSDAASGEVRSCAVAGFAVVTAGQPHFGAREAGPLSEAACGSPELWARLDCAAEENAVLVGNAAVWVAGTSAPAAALAAMRHAAAAGRAGAAPGGPPLEETARLVRYTGPGGTAVWLGTVSARDEMGVCGGVDETAWRLWADAGGVPGAPLGPWDREGATEVTGLVDTDGDGIPEVVTAAFPLSWAVQAAGGADRARLGLAYCDCAC